MHPITETQQRYLQALKALETRLKRPPTQTEIAELVGSQQQSVCDAMRRLERAGVVRRVKCEKWWRYTSKPSKLELLEQWARDAASYLRRCNRFDMTRDLEGILNEKV